MFIVNHDGTKYIDVSKILSIDTVGAGSSWQTRVFDITGAQTSLYVGSVQADAELVRDNFLKYVGLVTL